MLCLFVLSLVSESRIMSLFFFVMAKILRSVFVFFVETFNDKTF